MEDWKTSVAGFMRCWPGLRTMFRGCGQGKSGIFVAFALVVRV
ncbi:chemotaxis protein CheR [Mobiluncus mulieris]|uniref:Chemotaxis protein CheR n=1 Tax=Mobiluncus mulieris TaxID=2052 RepID=A0ABD4TZ89_9ACTO|nr:chemotaxis protein CheR [Mobiluncus mulieris]MCU9974040.1 chemotaxis protein CheR [Mobiluncus mulieris]MCU9994362.1 chemotaxis protein CheR [Mobiluncus mulieris]MCV0010035.1 chemotaxis protein CheR [Mobiluncus mulieris]NMX01634.1 chemotaxis protein CheR [Mobiluncus mulieris]